MALAFVALEEKKNDNDEPNSLSSWPWLLELLKKESKGAMKKRGFEPSLPCNSKLLAIVLGSLCLQCSAPCANRTPLRAPPLVSPLMSLNPNQP
jgi:hypothetical protein